jgi:hypothetical protein
MARHDKSKSRVTPKGTVPVEGSGREPVQIDPPSAAWVPALMFALLGLGTVLILANYTIEILGMPSNWYLLAGLGMVLGGIVTATQYR